MPDATPSSVKSALSRRAFAEVKASLAAAPSRLGALWPKLTPLERAACWRLLPPEALAAAARSLSPAARWEAYQASSTECAAPLLEDAPLGARALFRAWTRREAVLLKKGIIA